MVQNDNSYSKMTIVYVTYIIYNTHMTVPSNNSGILKSLRALDKQNVCVKQPGEMQWRTVGIWGN